MKDTPIYTLHERAVIEYINRYTTARAINPTDCSLFSDTLIEYNGATAWSEIKMTVDSNMINTRVRYLSGVWTCRGKSPVGDYICSMLERSRSAHAFIEKLRAYTGKDPAVDSNWPTVSDMNTFIKSIDDQYIHAETNVDISEIVRLHYLQAKSKCTYYMQAGDNFYRVSEHNPLGVPDDVPVFSAVGTLKVRVAIRSKRYEMQAEAKVKQSNLSPYSLYPFTKKLSPFLNKT